MLPNWAFLLLVLGGLVFFYILAEFIRHCKRIYRYLRRWDTANMAMALCALFLAIDTLCQASTHYSQGFIYQFFGKANRASIDESSPHFGLLPVFQSHSTAVIVIYWLFFVGVLFSIALLIRSAIKRVNEDELRYQRKTKLLILIAKKLAIEDKVIDELSEELDELSMGNKRKEGKHNASKKN
jgi:hypothetical protein